MVAGSDERAMSFLPDVIFGLLVFIHQDLSMRARPNHWEAAAVNPTLLTLTQDVAVRDSFLAENARLNHSMGFSTCGGVIPMVFFKRFL